MWTKQYLLDDNSHYDADARKYISSSRIRCNLAYAIIELEMADQERFMCWYVADGWLKAFLRRVFGF